MIKRIYDNLLEDHFTHNRQMAFISGPRQVGKTTTSQSTQNPCIYLNWDNQTDRNNIIRGPGRGEIATIQIDIARAYLLS